MRVHTAVAVRRTPDGSLVSGGRPLLDVLAGAGPGVLLDVANDPGDASFDGRDAGTARLLVALLAGTPYDVTVASADWYSAEVARDAGLRSAFRSPEGVTLAAALAYVVTAGHAECHPHYSAVLAAPEEVAAAHEQGRAVVCRGVPDQETAERLRAAGVDGIVLDDD